VHKVGFIYKSDYQIHYVYICNKNQQNAHFFIKDLIQSYYIRYVSNSQVFTRRKTCTCSSMVFFRAEIPDDEHLVVRNMSKKI
jgi:hypothetical protein